MEEDHEQLKHGISMSKRNQDQETRHLERKKLKLSPSTNSYDLRENRKKTWRIAEFSSEETIPVLDSQSSDNGTEPQVPSRRKRSERRKRYSKITSPCISEIELEEVAMCLIMLSGDKDLLRLNSRRDSSSLIDFDSSEINSVFGEDPAQNSGQNRTKVVSLKELKEKSNQFECTTCSKMFASYQALGGHRASHKKTNIPCSELADETTTSPLKRKNKKKETKGETNEHECPICLKVFPSGQALGGHKRSHLLPSETKDLPSPPQLPISSKPIPEVRDFLDLNLPAPMEEQEEESTCVVTFKPCWVGTDLKHEPVVSLIAN